MSAEEALAYGLIDEIVQPNDEKLRQLSLPPPSQVFKYFFHLFIYMCVFMKVILIFDGK